MKVAIRVDASSRIGSGHLVRCLTLATALRDQGADVGFVCRAHPGARLDLVRARGFRLVELPAPVAAGTSRPEPVVTGRPGHSGWLGVSTDQDAADTVVALEDSHPDWLVVDHYALARQWQQRLRPHVGGILVIDDLADRGHDCDLLLDQNHGAQQRRERYRNLAPGAGLLLGPRHALLDRSYRDLRRSAPRAVGPVRRVLLFLSAADTPVAMDTLLDALERLDQQADADAGLQVDVVMNPQGSHWQPVRERLRRRPQWRLHGLMPSLTGLLAQADLAIGAGGATCWERLCLGVPSAAVILADNQRMAVHALAQDQLLLSLGEAADLDPDNVQQALAGLIDDLDRRRQMAEAGTRLVDGWGAQRVAARMLPDAWQRWHLRPAAREAGPDSDQRLCWSVERGGLPVATLTARSSAAAQASGPGDAEDPVLELHWHPDCDPDEPETAAATAPWPALLRPMQRQLLAGRRRRVKAGALVAEALPLVQLARLEASSRQRIAILSDTNSWLNDYLPQLLAGWLQQGHQVVWAHHPGQLPSADVCFYLGCSRIVDAQVRSRYRHNLVVHESDLPEGRGWSPLSWQILEGRSRIAVTLFEAVDELDAGPVFGQTWLQFEGHELNGELKAAQFQATADLCREFVAAVGTSGPVARRQQGEPSYWPRRRKEDSRLDPHGSLAGQFNLLRIVDNRRYPAWFEWQGQAYELAIRKHRPG